MKKYIVTLTEDERKALSDLTVKGKQKSQKILNALILLGCDEGEYQTEGSTNEEIARVLHISMREFRKTNQSKYLYTINTIILMHEDSH